MTLKQYQRLKLAFTIVLAFVFSQSLIFKNYLLPIALLVVSTLVLIYLRRQVKEVVADERDRAIGGRSALLAIQIYSWVAALAMFVLYALRDLNPAYEPIGMTLAFSTCLLLLLYSGIFRYHDRIKFTSRKTLYVALISLLFLALAIFSLRLFSGEDDWLCQDGAWVKHGQPDFSAPSVPCK